MAFEAMKNSLLEFGIHQAISSNIFRMAAWIYICRQGQTATFWIVMIDQELDS